MKNREAAKRFYDSNPGYYRDYRTKSRQEKSSFIREQKNVPCTDCEGVFPFYVMQFDHVTDDKKYNISTMCNASWKQIYEELAKCEVVCANCHCTRTFERGQQSGKRKTVPV